MPASAAHIAALKNLLTRSRWAALATISNDGPLCSWVAFVPEPGLSSLLLHLSQLAPHTRNLLRQPRVSLGVSEIDRLDRDPQTLQRASLVGRAVVLERDAPDYPAARKTYLSRLPQAEPLFDFSDFQLFRFMLEQARFIGGFAQAFTVSPAQLSKVDG